MTTVFWDAVFKPFFDVELHLFSRYDRGSSRENSDVTQHGGEGGTGGGYAIPQPAYDARCVRN
jgi:hypothetical protein